MEYLLFLSPNPERPWAVCCPTTKETLTARQVTISCPSETISATREYLEENFFKEPLPKSPMYSLKAYGNLNWIDDDHAEITGPSFSGQDAGLSRQ